MFGNNIIIPFCFLYIFFCCLFFNFSFFCNFFCSFGFCRIFLSKIFWRYFTFILCSFVFFGSNTSYYGLTLSRFYCITCSISTIPDNISSFCVINLVTVSGYNVVMTRSYFFNFFRITFFYFVVLSVAENFRCPIISVILYNFILSSCFIRSSYFFPINRISSPCKCWRIRYVVIMRTTCCTSFVWFCDRFSDCFFSITTTRTSSYNRLRLSVMRFMLYISRVRFIDDIA